MYIFDAKLGFFQAYCQMRTIFCFLQIKKQLFLLLQSNFKNELRQAGIF